MKLAKIFLIKRFLLIHLGVFVQCLKSLNSYLFLGVEVAIRQNGKKY